MGTAKYYGIQPGLLRGWEELVMLICLAVGGCVGGTVFWYIGVRGSENESTSVGHAKREHDLSRGGGPQVGHAWSIMTGRYRYFRYFRWVLLICVLVGIVYFTPDFLISRSMFNLRQISSPNGQFMAKAYQLMDTHLHPSSMGNYVDLVSTAVSGDQEILPVFRGHCSTGSTHWKTYTAVQPQVAWLDTNRLRITCPVFFEVTVMNESVSQVEVEFVGSYGTWVGRRHNK